MAEGPPANFTVGGAGELGELLFDVGPADTGQVEDDTDLRPRDRLYQRLMPVWGDQ